jgi:acyl carrier protein
LTHQDVDPTIPSAVGSEESIVKRHLMEVCAVDASAIRPDVPLLEYGLDSARGIDLLVALEAEFDIRIPDQDAAKLSTLADIVAYVRERVAAR